VAEKKGPDQIKSRLGKAGLRQRRDAAHNLGDGERPVEGQNLKWRGRGGSVERGAPEAHTSKREFPSSHHTPVLPMRREGSRGRCASLSKEREAMQLSGRTPKTQTHEVGTLGQKTMNTGGTSRNASRVSAVSQKKKKKDEEKR